jgi:hypothetical protein
VIPQKDGDNQLFEKEESLIKLGNLLYLPGF